MKSIPAVLAAAVLVTAVAAPWASAQQAAPAIADAAVHRYVVAVDGMT
jgi:hypothetical protein